MVVCAASALLLGLSTGIGAASSSTAVGSPLPGGPVPLVVIVPLIVGSPPSSASPGKTSNGLVSGAIASSGLIGRDALADYTSPTGLLTRELDAVVDRPVTLGIDPMIIASIRVLGGSAPASAIAWLNRLAKATNDTFPLSYADADTTLMTQSDPAALIQPESFTFALDPALFSPPTTAAPGPTLGAGGSPTLGAGTLPPLPKSADDVLAWPYRLSGIAWPRAGTLVGTDVARLASIGYTSVIAGQANLGESRLGPVQRMGSTDIIAASDSVSNAIADAAAAGTENEWSSALLAVEPAVLAVSTARSLVRSPVVTALDRTTAVTAERLRQTLDSLAADPAVVLSSLSSVLDGPAADSAAEAGGVTLIDAPQPAQRLGLAARMLAAERAERAFAAIGGQPDSITAPRRLSLLASMGLTVDAATSPAGSADDAFTTAGANFLAQSAALMSSVHLVQSGTFLLLADNSQFLPVTVSNALNQRVSVYITVRPQSGLLAVEGGPVLLEVDPSSQAKANIPVRSLSNGAVQVTVTLTGATGTAIGSSVSADVNVQAGWETPVVVAIALLVVLVFVVGIVRTIVRRRAVRDV